MIYVCYEVDSDFEICIFTSKSLDEAIEGAAEYSYDNKDTKYDIYMKYYDSAHDKYEYDYCLSVINEEVVYD